MRRPEMEFTQDPLKLIAGISEKANKTINFLNYIEMFFRYNNSSQGKITKYYRAIIQLFAVLSLSFYSVKIIAADSKCPRKVEIMAYGFNEASPETFKNLGKINYEQRWLKDNSFNRMVFLRNFRGLFESSRLILNVKDQPEYSLTATFCKSTNIDTGEPISYLSIVLSFNGGEGCYQGFSYFYSDSDIPCYYHSQKLLSWFSQAPGHDITAHVPLMAAQISISKIENTMTAFEQIPVSAEFKETPEWCNEPGLKAQSGRQLVIYVENFKSGAPPMEGATHPVRLLVRSQNGTIINGEFITEDPNIKVFTISPLDVGKSAFIKIDYRPPDGEDNSDVLTIYNSCDVYYEKEVPLSETKKGSMILEVENQCGWEGTISKVETMEAGKNGSVLAALSPGGEYDISKNWKIRLKLKRTGDRFNAVLFEFDQALLLNFKDEYDQTMFKMEREGRLIEGKSKETASSRGRSLSASECDLKLLVDKEKTTYRIYGSINVQGIPIRGNDEMDIKVKPINEELEEGTNGTTGIDEKIEISGTFKPEGPEKIPLELKGSIDLLKDLPEDFKKFLETLGGKQTQLLFWDLKRKNTIVRKG
jgi:hypothetical protein